MMDDIILSLGTYSGGLLGYSLSGTEEINDPTRLVCVNAKKIFAYSPHIGCVKAICSNESLLLTGSTDETVRIFDLIKKREEGLLCEHSASISAIDLLPVNKNDKTSFALTGAEDGTLSVWRSSDWTNLIKLQGHTGPILSISIHPSGRTALTVSGGDEKAIRLWDLMRGSCAISQKFVEVPLQVEWSQCGTLFGILFSKHILIRHATLSQLELTIPLNKCSSSLSCCYTNIAFLPHHILVSGDTTGQLQGFQLHIINNEKVQTSMTTLDDIDRENVQFSYEEIFVCNGNQQLNKSNSSQDTSVKLSPSRSKRICSLPPLVTLEKEGTQSVVWFASVNSEGNLCFWMKNLNHKDKELQPLLTINTGARVTAMDCNKKCCIWDETVFSNEERLPERRTINKSSKHDNGSIDNQIISVIKQKESKKYLKPPLVSNQHHSNKKVVNNILKDKKYNKTNSHLTNTTKKDLVKMKTMKKKSLNKKNC